MPPCRRAVLATNKTFLPCGAGRLARRLSAPDVLRRALKLTPLLLVDPERAYEMGRLGRRPLLERLHAEHEVKPYETPAAA